jgi:hypothetical protein
VEGRVFSRGVAFWGTGLRRVSIPPEVALIGIVFFKNCVEVLRNKRWKIEEFILRVRGTIHLPCNVYF